MKSSEYKSNNLIEHIKDLMPFERSIAGPGLRQSIKYFQDFHKEIKLLEIPSGKKIFDWTIPDEWSVKEAYIEHESGLRFAEYSKSNLHLVNYSCSVDKELSKKELIEKIYTIKEEPKAIPYRTTYYKRDWGFCLCYEDYLSLPSGKYKVVIRSTHQRGSMTIGECLLKGKSSKELMLSSYLCHPSMANNELSGPVVLGEIISRVKQLTQRHYSYRFALGSETIGAISYIYRRLNKLKNNVIAGLVLSCVGDDDQFSHIETPSGDSLIDKAMKAAFIGKKNPKTYTFLDRGSDERQYASPLVDLPIAGFCRSKYGEYSQYHTSLDNLDLVSNKGLQGSVDLIWSIIQAFEIGHIPKAIIIGEPQLGKRGLYTDTDHKGKLSDEVNTRLNILAYSNGQRDIFDICIICDIPLAKAVKECRLLNDKGLLHLKHI